MKYYEGIRKGYTVEVTVNGRLLNPRLDLLNYSPTGFEWTYGRSGPSQLALALLADHLANDVKALAIHRRFKFEVVVRLPKRGWILTNRDIDQALVNILRQEITAGDVTASGGIRRATGATSTPTIGMKTNAP